MTQANSSIIHSQSQSLQKKNANEMLRIFSRFNALFVRSHIRGAIREYQTQLIQRVKDDIETLHEKFKIQYMQSKENKMSHVRDLPPVSGSIIWAKQIDRQLTAYMRRVEDVLGKGWANYKRTQRLACVKQSDLSKPKIIPDNPVLELVLVSSLSKYTKGFLTKGSSLRYPHTCSPLAGCHRPTSLQTRYQ